MIYALVVESIDKLALINLRYEQEKAIAQLVESIAWIIFDILR